MFCFQYAACDACQWQSTMLNMAPELKPIKVISPWHMVGMDLIGKKNDNKYVLRLTDYFTKFVDFSH